MNEMETVDLSNFETGLRELMDKLPFPPGPDGKPMPDMQKSMLLQQLVMISVMN